MSDQMKKLLELKKKIDEIKTRLDHIIVDGSAGNGAVTVSITGNKKVKGIVIEDRLFHIDHKQELLDYLEIAINDAIGKSDNVSQAEMMAAQPGILPGLE